MAVLALSFSFFKSKGSPLPMEQRARGSSLSWPFSSLLFEGFASLGFLVWPLIRKNVFEFVSSWSAGQALFHDVEGESHFGHSAADWSSLLLFVVSKPHLIAS